MELKGRKDRVSYSIGVDIGRSLQKNGMDVDVDVIARGMKDLMTGGALLMSDEEVHSVFEEVKAESAERKHSTRTRDAERNRAEGDIFLARNGRREGVISLPSGLQYRVLKEGTGRTPGVNDVVNVHYRGSLIDGTEFDSSYKRQQPAMFPVTRVIKGWTEALQLMKEGSHWEVVIPSNLAYGESGTPGGPIGPNQVLVFEIELLEIFNAEQGMPSTA